MGKYSKYKNVTFFKAGSSRQYEFWQAGMMLKNGKKWSKKCKTEKEAAMAVDLKLIELGKEPINILKRR